MEYGGRPVHDQDGWDEGAISWSGHHKSQISSVQGYLFCSFAELNNSAKNSKNCEKWKETTKFTRDLSRF